MLDRVGATGVVNSGRRAWGLRVGRRGVALVTVVALVAIVGCGGDEASTGTEDPTVSRVEPGASVFEDPWSEPSITGNDFSRSARLLTGADCAPGTPDGVAAPGSISVVRAIDECPRFENDVAGEGSVAEQLEELRAQPDVLAADVVPIVAPDSLSSVGQIAARTGPGDPKAKNQWHLEMLGADKLPADLPLGDVVVAVIDTGMDTTHADLADTVHTTSGVAFADASGANRLDLRDENYSSSCQGETGMMVGMRAGGHGSHVAGLIGAQRDNGAAGRGLAAGVQMLPLDFGFSTAEAIYLATDAGARVVNMSFAHTDPKTCLIPEDPKAGWDQLTEWAVRYALAHDVVLVASAGNCGGDTFKGKCEGPDVQQYPASYTGVISVASVNSDRSHSGSSTANGFVSIAAPGGKKCEKSECSGVLSVESASSVEPDPSKRNDQRPHGDETVALSGTSQAAPLVAATAALIIAANPALTAQKVRRILLDTAVGLGTKGRWSPKFGVGLVDPVAAVRLARSPPVTAEELAALDATALCQRFEGQFAVEVGAEFDGEAGVWTDGAFDASPDGPAFSIGDLDGDGIDDGAVIITCEFPLATSYVPEIALVVTAATRQPLRADLGDDAQLHGMEIASERRQLLVRSTRGGPGEARCCYNSDVEQAFEIDAGQLRVSSSRAITFDSTTSALVGLVNAANASSAGAISAPGVYDTLREFQSRVGELRADASSVACTLDADDQRLARCEVTAAPGAAPGWMALLSVRRNGWGDFTVTETEEFTGDDDGGDGVPPECYEPALRKEPTPSFCAEYGY